MGLLFTGGVGLATPLYGFICLRYADTPFNTTIDVFPIHITFPL